MEERIKPELRVLENEKYVPGKAKERWTDSVTRERERERERDS